MIELRRRYGSSAGGGQPSRLPAGYKEVEYIEGTKGAYIDPNTSIGANSAVEVDFMILEASLSPYHTDVFGYSGAAANFLVRYESRKDVDIFMSDGTVGSRFGFELNKRYNVKINKNGYHEYTINGIEELIIPVFNSVPTYPAYLMASYGLANGNPYAAGCQRNYLSKFYENGSLVRDLIPCINPDGEAGMYDLVGKQFYGNAGTGEFIAGAVVGGKPTLPKEYQEVEYLESTGTQYLIIPFENVKHTDVVRYKFMYFSSQIQQEAHIYGTNFLNGNHTTITRYSQDGGWFRWYTHQYYHDNIPFERDTIVSEEIKYPNVISNGITYKLGAISSETLYSNYLVLFGAMYNGTINAPMKGRFYYFEVEDKVNLIPCRRLSDNVKGMYDIVNDVFYTNAGTGEFLCGADVNPVAKLPSEYQEVDYLESSGSQYIDLGLSMPNGFIFESHVTILKDIDLQCIIGCHNATNPYQLNTFFYTNYNQSYGYTLGIDSNNIGSGNSDINKRISFKVSTCDNYYINIDDLTVRYGTVGAIRSEKNIYLFANNNLNDTLPSQYLHARVEESKIKYPNGELARHLIPCYRKADLEVGMYDIVEGKFYTNAGTGEFIVGPDII